jgi:hypothetical protein
MRSAKWKPEGDLHYTEGIDKPIVKPQLPMFFDLESDPREEYNLLKDKLDMEWMFGIALAIVGEYEQSRVKYPTSKPARSSRGTRPTGLEVPEMAEQSRQHLQAPSLANLTPWRTLVRQLLLASAAIDRRDPATTSILGNALQTARRWGFCNTVVTTAPKVTTYLVEHSAPARHDPFTDQLIAAAFQVRAAEPGTSQRHRVAAHSAAGG